MIPEIVAMIAANSLEREGGAGARVGKHGACGVLSSGDGVRAH